MATMSKAVAALVAMFAGASSTWAVGLWDPNFTSGKVRGDYLSPTGTSSSPLTLSYSGAGAQGCLFNAHDSFMGCPGRRLAGFDPHLVGNSQKRPYCGGSSSFYASTWFGCAAYDQTNAISINSPQSQYWVVHANLEPSFDQCNSGPPGQSEPVSTSSTPSGLFTVYANPSNQTVRLTVDNSAYDFSCVAPPTLSAPFLSIGANSNRGNVDNNGQPKPVGLFYFYNDDPLSKQTQRLQFRAQIQSLDEFGCKPGTEDRCSPQSTGFVSGFYLTAHWGGKRRMLFVNFYDGGIPAYPNYSDVMNARWNWPVQQSMFYPGAEIGLMLATPGNALASCGLNVPRLPSPYWTPVIGWRPGDPRDYDISIRRLFECAYEYGILSGPITLNQQVLVESVNWYIETYATEGSLSLNIQNPTIN